MLRLITPTTFTAATPRNDAAIHGIQCPAGQSRLLFLAAANPDLSSGLVAGAGQCPGRVAGVDFSVGI